MSTKANEKDQVQKSKQIKSQPPGQISEQIQSVEKPKK